MNSQPPPSSSANVKLQAEVPHDWPEVGTPKAPDAGQRVADDDMASDPVELETFFPQQATAGLAGLLEGLRVPQVDYNGKPSSLDDVYSLWDKQAQEQQVNHLWLVRGSGIAAFFAVALAIIQLPQLEWEKSGFAKSGFVQGMIAFFGAHDLPGMFERWELISAGLALVAVLGGIWAAYSHRWQLRRLQAEQCRFVKFGYLLRCTHSLDEAAAFLSEGVRRLVQLDAHYLQQPSKLAKRWVRGEIKLTPMPCAQAVTLSEETARQLIGYFLRKRLRFQAKYFKRQSHRREFREKLLAWLPVTAFFASLIFAMAHFAITHLSESSKKPHFIVTSDAAHAPEPKPADHKEPAAAKSRHHNSAALVCLVLAAGLPAFAAFVRTYRGALEFARNANRFHGMWSQLYDAEQELQRRKDRNDLAGQLEVLRGVEVALESEHRAWIRLMVEAEWYG